MAQITLLLKESKWFPPEFLWDLKKLLRKLSSEHDLENSPSETFEAISYIGSFPQSSHSVFQYKLKNIRLYTELHVLI